MGLERGIPLLARQNESKADGLQNRRADVELYASNFTNKRSNWEMKSYEILSSNEKEMQGMRPLKVYANSLFSPQTGIYSKENRFYDPARGVWMSPSLKDEQNLLNIIGNYEIRSDRANNFTLPTLIAPYF